ncbi:MAG: hypothetical protein GAK38_04299 [Xylophilus sp.]|nr:MAG: hypothetical protein GAK38_04299 [Xylophilus sp.]
MVAAAGVAHAQEATLKEVSITNKRENRVSTGATGLPLEIKETPQTISVIDQEDITDYGLTGSNEALRSSRTRTRPTTTASTWTPSRASTPKPA